MSLVDKYFAGWTFRTTKPTLTVGDEVSVFINRYEDHATDGDRAVAETASGDEGAEADGVGVARIGDTLLYVEGVGPEHVEMRVRVRINEFDETTSTGRGEYLETVGESSYTG